MCIHSQPLLGRLTPGEARVVKGAFYLILGGIKELEAQARMEFGERLGNCNPRRLGPEGSPAGRAP